MTSFTDGPAAGVVLNLRRAPLFLRVVQAGNGTWDALDQLADMPAPDETVTVYRLVRNDGWIHINSRDRKTGRYTGGTFQRATYAVCETQPPDEVVRSNKAWALWALELARQAAEALAEGNSNDHAD